MENWQFKQRQALPLDVKILKSQLRIREWYEAWDGDVYVSFSGGKDSTVLLHLVRLLYPDVPAVFFNTRLEFPEIVRFVKQHQNVHIVRPKMRFQEVITKYGYPVISKEQSYFIYQARNTKSDKLRNVRLNGYPNGKHGYHGKISDKWRFMLNAPFKISDKCCHCLKKKPAYRYEKETNRKPILGSLACESSRRTMNYLKTGCNSFDTNRPTSSPIAFWTTDDVWLYLHQFNLPYCEVYDMGYKSTGCLFCMFGVHMEKEPNRFQLLHETHPKLWNYCINELKLGMVMDFTGIPYENKQLMLF